MPNFSVALCVDVAIALTAVELCALVATRARHSAVTSALALVPNLVSGLSLMLALRLAVAGGATGWIIAALAVSGIAHGVDVAKRWLDGRHSCPTVAPRR